MSAPVVLPRSFQSSPGRPLIDDAFLEDPYPAYDALREAGPIHWSNEFHGGAWVLARHDDVEAMLRDPRFSARRTGGWISDLDESARDELQDFQRLFARAMLFVDAPDHRRLRDVLNAGFRSDAIARLRVEVASLVDETLSDIDVVSGFDFVERVARPLPARVIARMMGVDEAEEEDFIAWSADLALFIGAPQPTLQQARQARAGLLAMSRYFSARIANSGPVSEDLVGRLIAASRAGAIESGPELLAQCAMLLFAGHETSRHLLANALYHLLSQRELWCRLQREPQRLPAAVRELLRFDSPVQYTARRVAAKLSLHGQTLRRGDLVIGLIGAANRDPRRYAQPHCINFDLGQTSSLAFGSGPHACIGAAVSLLEAEAVLGAALRRWPNLRLSSAKADWNRNALYRGLSTLQVKEDAWSSCP